MTYIDVRNLSKSFVVRKKQPHTLRRGREEVHALRDVSLRIERGEIVGCMGPNGAGKSTLVKILSGILLPDGGTATVDGRVPWMERKAHAAHIGAVFGQRTQLWWDVSPLESYGLLRDIYRTPREAWRQRLDEMTEALGLAEFLRTPLRQLSLGQRMRAELAGSLLHSPELLFLDEPPIGLDALSTLTLRAFLQEENRRHRTTVMLTTHDMADMTEVCRRGMVLGHGRMLYDGELAALLRRYDTEKTVCFRYEEACCTPPALPEGCVLRRQEEGYEAVFDPALLSAGEVIARLQKAGTLAEMTVQGRSVDRLVARMYEEMRL